MGLPRIHLCPLPAKFGTIEIPSEDEIISIQLLKQNTRGAVKKASILVACAFPQKRKCRLLKSNGFQSDGKRRLGKSDSLFLTAEGRICHRVRTTTTDGSYPKSDSAFQFLKKYPKRRLQRPRSLNINPIKLRMLQPFVTPSS